VNAIPAIILNVCPRFVRKPVRVTLSRGRQCSVERFLRVAAIGLRSLVSERWAASVAAAAFFLRKPSRSNPTKPLANSGSAAGSGTGAGGE
jgi:hypothetical protein